MLECVNHGLFYFHIMDSTGFDPSLPGIRLIQSWIREQRVLGIELNDGRRLDGRLAWQDPHYFALQKDESNDPILINRLAVLTIRPLA
ncbi:hypothetical protein SynBIOSU31_01594 [Synechococcus sp. BIOS-U3-1]|nr:hypothetical protein SynBIOSU31_01594 [Synechococcus sp. BIOS-U3-1]